MKDGVKAMDVGIGEGCVCFKSWRFVLEMVDGGYDGDAVDPRAIGIETDESKSC